MVPARSSSRNRRLEVEVYEARYVCGQRGISGLLRERLGVGEGPANGQRPSRSNGKILQWPRRSVSVGSVPVLLWLSLAVLNPGKELTKHQREIVYRRCLHPISKRLEWILVRMFVTFLSLLPVVCLDRIRGWESAFVLMLVIMVVAGEISDLIVVAFSRKEVARWLAENELPTDEPSVD